MLTQTVRQGSGRPGCRTYGAEWPTIAAPAFLAVPQKLEQLSEELEHLTTGLPTSAVNGSSHAAASSSAAHGAAAADAMVQVQVGAAPAGQLQKQRAGAGEGGTGAAAAQGNSAAPAADARTAAAEQQAREEAARRQLEQQQQAVAARARHVQLGGRRAGSSGNGSPVAAPTRIPQPPVARTSSSGGSGRFEGFD